MTANRLPIRGSNRYLLFSNLSKKKFFPLVLGLTFFTYFTTYYYSDFRYESNGIFVLGVVFFFYSDQFRLFY